MVRKHLIAGLVGLMTAVPAAGGRDARAASAAAVNPLVGEWLGELKVGNSVLTDQFVLNADGTYSDMQYGLDYWAFVNGKWTAKGELLTFTATFCAWNGNVDHCVPGAPGSVTTKTYGALFRELNAKWLLVYSLGLKIWVPYLRQG